MTPIGSDGVNRCSWTPTAEDVDCTILWPTEGPADSWWTTAEPAARQNMLFGFGTESLIGQTMDSQVSLSTVVLLLLAAFAVYKTYQWRYSGKQQVDKDGYQQLNDNSTRKREKSEYQSIF
jgi:hypothetical protein